MSHLHDATSVPGQPGTDVDVLTATGVFKSYGGIRALRGADLALRPGEIHGLIGENGSGKSTLLGVLSGQTVPDAGSIMLNGNTVALGDTRPLRSHVAIVTQELSLAPDLSVAENILMSHDKPTRFGQIAWKQLYAQARTALERLHLDIDPKTPVGRLRIDQQQLVEIAKAVELRHPVLILDEPTSSLTEDAVASLAQTMQRLKETGIAIVFVSHRLDEFFSLTDHVTVLRDGQTVATRPIGDYTRALLIEDMLGYPVEHYEHESQAQIEASSVLLRADAITVPGAVHGASFTVHEGEIVGLVGLEGAGRSELLQAMFGAVFTATGSVEINGSTGIPASPQQAMQRGIGLVPGDRKSDGLMLEMTIVENLNIARTSGGWRLRPINRSQEGTIATEASTAVRIQKGSPNRAAGSLSGGNQQKVLLAKWLTTEPTVLLLDEPTRGVDVGAKREIHELISSIRERGIGIVVSSSDIEELLLLSDRFIVMFRGRVVGELTRSEATQARLSHLATGGPA